MNTNTTEAEQAEREIREWMEANPNAYIGTDAESRMLCALERNDGIA